MQFVAARWSQRDVVYLGWPIAPLFMSPNAWGGGGCDVSANEYSCAHGSQINFGDLTPYLTYGCWWGRGLEGWPNTAARLAGWRIVALTGAAQLRADGISSWCFIINLQSHPPWATSRKEGKVWYSCFPPYHPVQDVLYLNYWDSLYTPSKTSCRVWIDATLDSFVF